MDWGLLLAGLPVAIVTSGIGVWLISRGLVGIGMVVTGLGILGFMLAFGHSMPRPEVVPRPGEEGEY